MKRTLTIEKNENSLLNGQWIEFFGKNQIKVPEWAKEETMATSLSEMVAEFSIFKIVEKLWGFLASGIGQKITEKAGDALVGKIMKDGGLDDELVTMEVLGKYYPEPNGKTVKLLEEAIGRLQKEHPKFASNLRRVIGSTPTFFIKKEEGEKKDEEKIRNILAYLCGGVDSIQEILDRIEKIGLYNEAPDGTLDKIFVGGKKVTGKVVTSTVESAKNVAPVLAKGTATAVASGLIALVAFVGAMFAFLMIVLFVLWVVFF